MAGLTLFMLAAFLGELASAASCTTPRQRRAWHTFNDKEKLDYINAELCLMDKPAKLTHLPGVQTRFDDFQAMHQNQSYKVHNVAAFLPFHRALLHAHEQALRDECGYTGTQPYWYEQLDAGNFSKSAIFDPDYGFGGNGTGPNRCIADGPFANYTNHLGPSYEITDHCIDRNISDVVSLWTAQSEIDKCLKKDTWLEAWPCIEGLPHRGGHTGVGGQMRNPVSSPGDPLFYLHHSYVDKIWADWQALNPKVRLTEMGGKNTAPDIPGNEAIVPPIPAWVIQPTGADGDPANVTTLTHVLDMKGNGPNLTIADVMNVSGDYLCFEYVEPGQ